MQDWLSFYWFQVDTLRSFSWERIYSLFFLVAVPLVFFLKWIFRSQSRERLAITLDVSKAGRFSDFVANLRYLPPFFMALAATCFILALARPQRILETKEQYSDGIDIMIALDISESMKGQDLPPNRLIAAKKVAKDFISGRFQDRIGLVAFAGEAYLLSPPTTDYEILNQILDDLDENTIPAVGTAIGDALAKCVNRMREVSSDSKVIVLISDGSDFGSSLSPEMVAKLSVQFNIKIYTVAVGGFEKRADVEPVDEKSLKEIAKASKGKFFRASNTETLKSIFKEINAIEQVKIKAQNFKDVRDYYFIYIIWGIIFLLVSMLLKTTFMGNVLED